MNEHSSEYKPWDDCLKTLSVSEVHGHEFKERQVLEDVISLLPHSAEPIQV